MKSTTISKPLIILGLTLGFVITILVIYLPDRVNAQGPIGTAFTYQGRLTDGGTLADGIYDFEFKLFDAADGGNQLFDVITKDDVAVIDGTFTVELDFGNVFVDLAFWLEIGVRPGNSTGAYTTLAPRQPLTPAPFARYSSRSSWSGLIGVPPGFADGIDNEGGLTLPFEGNAYAPSTYVFSVTNTDNDFGSGISGVGSVTGVYGNGSDYGVYGVGDETGVYGTATTIGVEGESNSVEGYGVYGRAYKYGVFGHAITDGGTTYGVYGKSNSLDGYGVYGDGGTGVYGTGGTIGVHGIGEGTGEGVHGVHGYTNGDFGWASGVYGTAGKSNALGVSAWHTGDGTALYAVSNTGKPFAAFSGEAGSEQRVFYIANNGNVYADGSYNCGLNNGCFNTGPGADVAERIDVNETLQTGDVVEIDPENPLYFRRSITPYSSLVVGVVSTNPAITMNNNDLMNNDSGERTDERPLLALVGQVPVKVSAENGSIVPGDFLVASATPGHAMRCEGFETCFGRTIGKALEPLEQGTGVIMMLVTLQ